MCKVDDIFESMQEFLGHLLLINRKGLKIYLFLAHIPEL